MFYDVFNNEKLNYVSGQTDFDKLRDFIDNFLKSKTTEMPSHIIQ